MEVIIVDYNYDWPITFGALRDVLARTLGSVAVAIEHVGSTSVPGLAAKPILDVDIVILTREQLPEAIRRLASLGYRHQGDLGIPGREAFARTGSDVPRDGMGRDWPTHNLYVCPQDSAELARHLRFRNYLRAHPEAARAYGDLKRELAARFRQDRDGYSKAKTAFVEEILKQAAIEAHASKPLHSSRI